MAAATSPSKVTCDEFPAPQSGLPAPTATEHLQGHFVNSKKLSKFEGRMVVYAVFDAVKKRTLVSCQSNATAADAMNAVKLIDIKNLTRDKIETLVKSGVNFTVLTCAWSSKPEVRLIVFE